MLTDEALRAALTRRTTLLSNALVPPVVWEVYQTGGDFKELPDCPGPLNLLIPVHEENHWALLFINARDKTTNSHINTLCVLPTALRETSNLERALLANNPKALTKRDIFADRRLISPNIEHDIGLSS